MQTQTVIGIVNEKGGTGKTTTAVNLAAALGELNQKVLLVDLDGQAASSRWLGVEEDDRLAEALYSGRGLEPIEDILPGVHLAPASGKLDSVAHNLRPTQGGQLRKVISEMKGYDFVLIDCPPSLGNRLIGNALLAATHVIVPVETSILAVDGLKILLTTLEDIRDGFEHELIFGGVVACRYDRRTRLSPLVLAELRRALPGKVFDTVIRENVRLRECPASAQSILTFAPNSHASEDYRALARELLDCPQKWRNPLPADAGQAGAGDGGNAYRVDDLRSNASAAVCDATRNASWRKSLADQQDDQVDSGMADAIAADSGQAPSEIETPQADVTEVWMMNLSESEQRIKVADHAEEERQPDDFVEPEASPPEQIVPAEAPSEPPAQAEMPSEQIAPAEAPSELPEAPPEQVAPPEPPVPAEATDDATDANNLANLRAYMERMDVAGR